jgi:sugar phosphate isomerase/epimerase
MLFSFSRREFIQSSIAATLGASALGVTSQTAQAIAPIQRGVKGARMKLSCAAYSYRDHFKTGVMTMYDFLEVCATMGLDGAEPTSYYFPDPLTNEWIIDYKRRAFLLGLDISGTAVGNTFTYNPGPEREKEIQHVKNWIDHAALLGAPSIRIFAGGIPKGSDMTLEQARKNAIEAIQEACAYAATRGVFLALENHGGIVPDADSMLAIVEKVDSDWFGVNLDTGNFRSADPYAEMARMVPYTMTVQVKIHIQPQGGEKIEADFQRILGILADGGYRGYVALEYEGAKDPITDVPRYIEKLQTILARM